MVSTDSVGSESDPAAALQRKKTGWRKKTMTRMENMRALHSITYQKKLYFIYNV